MAITSVQTPIQFNDANVVTAHTSASLSTTAGNRLVLAILAHATGVGKPTSVTDGASNAWSKITDVDSSLGNASIWATSNNASAISSGTYTINVDAAATMQATFYEFAGTLGGSVDTTHTGSGSSTSISSGSSGTLNDANEVCIGVGGNNLIFSDATYSSVAFTTAGGTFQTRTARSGLLQSCMGYLILSGSTTAQTFSATGPNNDWAAAIATFKAAVSYLQPQSRQTTVSAHRAAQW